MKILLTGFKAFNNEIINPTELIINNKHFSCDTLLLNVEYDNDAKLLISKLEGNDYDLVLLLGQAGGRKKVMIEYYALNIRNASIPDNLGVNKFHETILEDRDLAYKTNINVKELCQNINDPDFDISYFAGTYICNEIYYQALNYIYKNNLNTLCGFIHVPFIKEQVLNKPNMPYLELSKIEEIIEKIINTIA